MIISGPNSSALLLFKQTNPANFSRNALQTNDIAGAANQSTGSDQIAKILANAPGATTQDEVRLIQKVGQVLGVDENKYSSATDYGNALRRTVDKLKVDAIAHHQSWSQVQKGLEHKMGLDKLGISLDTVINAILGDSGSQDALRGAMEKQAEKNRAASASLDASAGDFGAYSPASALK